MNSYKGQPSLQALRNNRLEAQASIPSGKSGASRGKSVDEMTDQEYWDYLDRQDARKK